MTMKRQASRWHGLSLGYVGDIIALVQHCADQLISFLAHNDRDLCQRLKDLVQANVMDSAR